MVSKACILCSLAIARLMALPQPSAEQIVAESVKTTEADWKEAPNYSFLERDVESKHDGAKVIKTYEVLMIEGSQYNRLLAVNDRPLTQALQAAEQRKLEQEIYKRQHESDRDRKRRVAKYEKERTQDHMMLREMTEAFQYVLTGEANVNGRDVWVLDATPKASYVPVDHEAKVLTGMRGKMWVDKATYQWVKIEAEVVKPVSMFGFIAKVGPGTRFVFEQAPVNANATLWLPKRLNVNVNATALGFLNENSTEEDTFQNYRPMPKAMAELEATR